MIDLEQLDAFDDDAPPSPDLGQVRSRAGRLRTRNRVTAIGTCVALLVVAVGVVAVVRDRDHSVQVVGPSGATGAAATHPTVSRNLANGLQVELTLDTPTVVLGSDIEATVIVHNSTSEAKELGVGQIQCAIDLAPVLHNEGGQVVASGADQACYLPAETLEPDASRAFALTLSTAPVRYPGSYGLTLVETAGERPPWSLGPVAVRITGSDLAAHLETPRAVYPSGHSLDGTIVFENGTGAPVDYTLDCFHAPPWTVLLAKDGVRFHILQTAIGCTLEPLVTAQLAPGETRVPFHVVLGYPECSSAGATGPASPRCVDGGIPDLAPGTYQLVFEPRGKPFDSVDVAPITIEVAARPIG